LAHDDMTGRTSADPAAAVVQLDAGGLGEVQDAARQAVPPVGEFFRVDLEHLPRGQERDVVFLPRPLRVRLNVGVYSTHKILHVYMIRARTTGEGAPRASPPAPRGQGF